MKYSSYSHRIETATLGVKVELKYYSQISCNNNNELHIMNVQYI